MGGPSEGLPTGLHVCLLVFEVKVEAVPLIPERRNNPNRRLGSSWPFSGNLSLRYSRSGAVEELCLNWGSGEACALSHTLRMASSSWTADNRCLLTNPLAGIMNALWCQSVLRA